MVLAILILTSDDIENWWKIFWDNAADSSSHRFHRIQWQTNRSVRLCHCASSTGSLADTHVAASPSLQPEHRKRRLQVIKALNPVQLFLVTLVSVRQYHLPFFFTWLLCVWMFWGWGYQEWPQRATPNRENTMAPLGKIGQLNQEFSGIFAFSDFPYVLLFFNILMPFWAPGGVSKPS